MERLVCLIFGYLFGLIQSGYLYGKIHRVDIRQHGSGNSGSTNVLRVMGWKAGLTVFLGDFLKTVIPCLIIRLWFRQQPDLIYLYILYTAIGVILGHNYPFYMKFKGGKGIAATAGLLVSTDLRVTLVCLIVFILIVAITRYVSLGSLMVATIFFIGMLYFGMKGDYQINFYYQNEFYLLCFCVSALAFWKHRANIKRLLNGTENKVGRKSKS